MVNNTGEQFALGMAGKANMNDVVAIMVRAELELTKQ
jgi:hypothetical protein